MLSFVVKVNCWPKSLPRTNPLVSNNTTVQWQIQSPVKHLG